MLEKIVTLLLNTAPIRDKICVLLPLALAAVSVRAFRSVAHAHVNAQSFCLVFSKYFNIMSALSIHQLPTLPQIIDSREGLF